MPKSKITQSKNRIKNFLILNCGVSTLMYSAVEKKATDYVIVLIKNCAFKRLVMPHYCQQMRLDF
jgi:hypothetical protein